MPVDELDLPPSPVHSRPKARATSSADRGAAQSLPHASLESLRKCLPTDWLVVDAGREVLFDGSGSGMESGWTAYAGLCREVAGRRRPEFLAEDDPLILLGVPLLDCEESGLVAVGAFATRTAEADQVRAAAKRLGLGGAEVSLVTRTRQAWSPPALLHVAELVVDKQAAQLKAGKLKLEVEQVTSHLLTTYEEISLMHRLTQNLKLSRSDRDLSNLALDWLDEVLPVEGLAIKWNPTSSEPGHSAFSPHGDGALLLTNGKRVLGEQALDQLFDRIAREPRGEPLVLNGTATRRVAAGLSQVRELISVPLAEGDKLFGWLLAVNHREGGEFGTVEASLLGSVGAILSIHRSNVELYRQQAEFLASVVRALTSAIDAKDPYTCGHSDRVARVAVRLATEMGLDGEIANTIYMAGLLHDIGKIGIDDNVLRKPGRLTDAEYEHIKLHPALGYKILKDIKQLDLILPVVLHHHEAWDGTGYPHGLAGEAIPLLARIVAVADAFDAMSSDRPYRKGMPFAKLQEILKGGAGSQWDSQVVEAFFRAREDIQRIAGGRPSLGDEAAITT